MNSEDYYAFHLCSNIECLFRFPGVKESELGVNCPRCGASTSVSGIVKYNSLPRFTADGYQPHKISVFLDNIRSAYNVGSIFRTADGAGISHLYLSGITPTPDHNRVAKTALGADQRLSWSYYANGLKEIQELRSAGWVILGLENIPNSRPIDQTFAFLYEQPILLVVGNELAGIDPAILAICDHIINLPMLGSKQSLNVSVAFGVAVYWLQFA